ncbi:hypothetical protein [Bacillus sp. FJAT-47783]|uniref:hypothetical protein n=1 Tax=Bacillus sp. FJAT-47783 TaxID=2922712 RepID=UPI001FACECF9|nr:hypothetical protein [Bacillus sp. FJAT-47783]
MFVLIGTITITSIGLFVLFNWLMGYKKGNIVIDFDERYFNQKEYVEAIKNKLINEGRNVQYIGGGKFIIDGKKYLFIERNVSMGRVPMQRTILKLIK